MQSLLKKSGTAFFVLAVSGLINAAPAIAESEPSSEIISPVETSIESVPEVDELSSEEMLDSEVVEGDAVGSDVTPEESVAPVSEMPTEMPSDDVTAEDVTSDDMMTDEVVTDEAAPEEMLTEEASEDSTIVDIAASSDTFTTLVSALGETGLDNVLQGEGPFTVFAPTDEAFAALPPGTVEALMAPENRDMLTELLAYHVVSGEIASDDMETGAINSVQGAPLQVEVGDEVTVNGVSVVGDDIPASNGIIHAIDEVILPPQ